jgi:hypothetical protein
MRKALSIILAITMALACSFTIKNKIVRGNGVETTCTYDLPAFNAIFVAGSMDVVYTQGPQVVSLTADENLMDIYTIEVVDNILKISTKSGYSIFPKAKTFVTVSAEDLNGVKLAGSGECEIKGTLATKGDFTFSIAGSGDLDADAIICKNFSSKINGSGDVDVKALSAETTTLTINGSGDIDINCKDAGDIFAKINGSGDIALSGKAGSLTQKVNGSGSISSRGLQLGY